MLHPWPRGRLIIHSNIIRAPNPAHRIRRILLELMARQDTLLALFALDIREGHVVFAHHGALAAVKGGLVVVAAALLEAGAVSVVV